jgi:hypothetical protein
MLKQLTKHKQFHYTNTVIEQNLDSDSLLWLFRLLYTGRLLQFLASGDTYTLPGFGISVTFFM